VIQGTFGVIQGTFGVIQGTFGVISGTFGAIQQDVPQGAPRLYLLRGPVSRDVVRGLPKTAFRRYHLV
jgi:hypothetical protein